VPVQLLRHVVDDPRLLQLVPGEVDADLEVARAAAGDVDPLQPRASNPIVRARARSTSGW
jgi:hypothetical protein